MARSSDINQRIVLTGADEVRRHLDEIAAAGQRSGNQTRAALLAATGATNTFTTGARNAAVSSGQMRFALQNLSFQVNDVATSLATGGSAMRVFAQQGGQIFQAFQQGGGLGTVLSAAGSAISAMITPFRLAAAGSVALAAGFGLIVASAVSSADAARDFDVVLKAIGKSGQTTGKQLDAAAHSFRDVGLSTSEGRAAERQALLAGVQPQDIDRIVRTGAELNKIFGEGSLQKFIDSASEGGPALDDFAKRLGIVSNAATDTASQFAASDAALKTLNETITDEVRNRDRSIVEEQRSTNQQIKDLTRVRGTARKELELASSRVIEKINRDSEQKIADDFRQFVKKRSDDNAKALADFNKQAIDAAQKAGNAQNLASQIGQRVAGSVQSGLSPVGRAINEIGTAWDKLKTTLADSSFIQGAIDGFTAFVVATTAFIEKNPDLVVALAAVAAGVAALSVALGVLRLAFVAATIASGPWGLALAVIAGAILLIADNWKSLAPIFQSIGDFILGVIQGIANAFERIITAAKRVGDSLRANLGPGGPLSGDPSIPAMPLAGGGLVRGPGNGTSDSILARISNGEFVMPAVATRLFLPQLESMRSMFRMPQPRMPRGFAMGGLVTAGGGGSTVHLHLDGGSFHLQGDRGIVDALTRAARKSSLLSAGRKPSTA